MVGYYGTREGKRWKQWSVVFFQGPSRRLDNRGNKRCGRLPSRKNPPRIPLIPFWSRETIHCTPSSWYCFNLAPVTSAGCSNSGCSSESIITGAPFSALNRLTGEALPFTWQARPRFLPVWSPASFASWAARNFILSFSILSASIPVYTADFSRINFNLAKRRADS